MCFVVCVFFFLEISHTHTHTHTHTQALQFVNNGRETLVVSAGKRSFVILCLIHNRDRGQLQCLPQHRAFTVTLSPHCSTAGNHQWILALSSGCGLTVLVPKKVQDIQERKYGNRRLVSGWISRSRQSQRVTSGRAHNNEDMQAPVMYLENRVTVT